MNVRVKFVEGFKDGTIFPKEFAPGEFAVVTEQQLQRIQSSGGKVEVVENVIANPLKAEKLANERVMNDPLNADNSINQLETHIPGTEDEVAEQRVREAQRRADPSVKKVGAESVFNDEPARIDADARAKVEEAMLEREKAHRADREAAQNAEDELLDAVAEEEREEYVDAKVKADQKAPAKTDKKKK
jgi:hypothetical protein